MPDVNPYKDTWRDYQAHGFRGTLVMPTDAKFPPPKGYTGIHAGYPSKNELLKWEGEQWANTSHVVWGYKYNYKCPNIAIRCAGVDDEWELLVIDVDHYGDKTGGDTWNELCQKFNIPDTWVSTSRDDGISGKRFFLIPRGHKLRDDLKDIDTIYKRHRYAMVWPSWNPDSEKREHWFPPGVPLTEDGRAQWDGELPNAKTDFPKLALDHPFFQHLLRKNQKDSEEIDYEEETQSLYDWMNEHTPKGKPCAWMRSSIEKHKEKIDEDPTSHNKAVNFHWNLIANATEAHPGWHEAINEIEQYWLQNVLKREKRMINQATGELFRSRVNAIRKLKKAVERGKRVIPDRDLYCCPLDYNIPNWDGPGEPPDWTVFVQSDSGKHPPDAYDESDTDNGFHLTDLYNVDDRSRIRWIEALRRWIYWSEASANKTLQPGWHVDDNGAVRRLWLRVIERMEMYSEYLEELEKVQRRDLTNFNQNGGVIRGSKLDKTVKKLTSYRKWILDCKNNNRADGAIKNAAINNLHFNGSLLDANPNLLGVANGVLDLSGSKVTIRQAQPDDYVTYNTHVAWKPLDEISSEAKAKWQNYLDLFLPDEEYRRIVQTFFGYCLYGENPEQVFLFVKGLTGTGKSTFFNCIEAALGDYAGIGESSSIYKDLKLNPALAYALPRRIVMTSEFNDTDKIAVAQLKKLTGGEPIKVEIKYANDLIERVAAFVPVIGTNTSPEIIGADSALRRRIIKLSFDQRVSEDREDPEAGRKIGPIVAEAVLAWLVEGFEIWRKEGLPRNHVKVKEDTDEFASELDVVSTFAYEHLNKTNLFGRTDIRWQDYQDHCVDFSEVYSRYQSKCQIQEQKPLGDHILSRRLRGLGYVIEQVRPSGQESRKQLVGVTMGTHVRLVR